MNRQVLKISQKSSCESRGICKCFNVIALLKRPHLSGNTPIRENNQVSIIQLYPCVKVYVHGKCILWNSFDLRCESVKARVRMNKDKQTAKHITHRFCRSQHLQLYFLFIMTPIRVRCSPLHKSHSRCFCTTQHNDHIQHLNILEPIMKILHTITFMSLH